MKTQISKLLSPLNALLILSLTLMLGTVNATGYDDDKRGYKDGHGYKDKHDDDSKHKHGNKHRQVLITRVNVDFSGGEMHIYGKNLESHRGSTLVFLAGDELVTSAVTESQITAYLKPGTVAGDYLLTVRNGKHGKHGKYSDNYALTIGGSGIQGPQGEPGPAGVIGPTGLPGTPGLPGVTGPAGPTGIAGPAGTAGATGPVGSTGPAGVAGAAGPQGPIGPQGPAGGSGYQVLKEVVTTEINQGEEKLTPTCPAGTVAISGGIMQDQFPISILNSRDFNIAALHPDGSQNWRARWYNGSGTLATIALYTVCINSN